MRHLALTFVLPLATPPAFAATIQQDFDTAQALLDTMTKEAAGGRA